MSMIVIDLKQLDQKSKFYTGTMESKVSLLLLLPLACVLAVSIPLVFQYCH